MAYEPSGDVSNPRALGVPELALRSHKLTPASSTGRCITVSSLNTPKSKQVDELFEELIGLTNLHTRWSWQGINAEDAKKKLDEYIRIRGQIAHRVKHGKGKFS